MQERIFKQFRESHLERSHRQTAIDQGWFVIKIMKASLNGFPDRLYAKDGRVVLMEWKRPGAALSPQQEIRHQQLRDHGVEVHVVTSVEEADRILNCAL